MHKLKLPSNRRSRSLTRTESGRFTGSTIKGRSSSQSVGRTPQSSLRPTIRSAERKQRKQDTRLIQDKGWQKKQTIKVQNYFQQFLETQQLLNKNTSIRPITLTMFIQLTQFLLNRICPKFEELSSANYTDLLPTQLHTISYPGIVTSSMLKTANTMHSWPHVLAILSWLVGVDELYNCISTDAARVVLFEIDPEYSNDDKVKKLIIKIIFDSFLLWSNGTETVNQSKIMEKGLTEIYNYSPEIYEQTQKQINEINDHFEEMENERNRSNSRITSSRNKIKLEHEQLGQARKDISDEEDEKIRIRNSNNDRRAHTESLKKKIELTMQFINATKSQLGKQTMNIDERLSIIREIDAMEDKLKIQDDIILHRNNAQCERELEIDQKRSTVNRLLSNFKMALVEPAMKYPELKELKLPTNGSISENEKIFLQACEIKKVHIENVEKIIEQLKNLNEENNYKMKENEKELETLNHEKDLLLAEKVNCSNKLEKLENNVESESKEKEALLASIIKETEELENCKLDDGYYKKLQQFQKKKSQWEERIQKRGEEASNFFQKIYDHTVEEDKKLAKLSDSTDTIVRETSEALDPRRID